MGDPADDILSSFGLTDEETKSYDVVVDRFEKYFVKKRNIIFERARFNQHKQEDGESVDNFVTALYCLSEHCQYGELHDEMIRNHIVIGLCDSGLSEKLQLEAVQHETQHVESITNGVTSKLCVKLNQCKQLEQKSLMRRMYLWE